MAKNLVKQRLTDRDSYREVWIRDLNTFVELGYHVGEDRYIPMKEATVRYQFIYSKYEPHCAAHKNTVETDQKTSLIQAISTCSKIQRLSRCTLEIYSII